MPVGASDPGATPDAASEPGSSPWDEAIIAARLLAVDPVGLGGAVLTAGPGPVRDLWLDILRLHLPEGAPFRRMPASIEDDRLLGGVDLVATLKLGRPVIQSGILAQADGGVVVIPMAERLAVGIAARIAGAIDRGDVLIERDGVARRVQARIGVIALNVAVSSDEAVPAALLDRLAFHLDLSLIRPLGIDEGEIDDAATTAARERLAAIAPASDAILSALVVTAARFGIPSVVAPLLALRAARAAAALAGRDRIEAEDAILAARLVLAPRALTLPQTEAEESPESEEDPTAGEETSDETPPPPPPEGTAPEADQEPEDEPPPDAPGLEDILLAAVEAALPDGLLESLQAGRKARGSIIRRQGSGQAQAALRGRPAGVRQGSLRPGARLALVDTLRAAAPWQPVRRRETAAADSQRVAVRREDFRLKKFVQRRESTIVFCVDASGSTAFQRLAEAKGAVELLLAEAYVARTYAALIVFRGNEAELLLPPTRSLSRAKSLLANLPGGGGTPLASGIDLAMMTALGERARGREPLIVLLTDGRGNIARDGAAVRSRAGDDALDAARQLGLQGLAAVFVDTSARPRSEGADLANAMSARYVSLPYVEAGAVRDVVIAATPGLERAPPRSR